VYNDPKSGFSSIQDLKRKTGAPIKIIKEFLESQDVYTKFKKADKKFPKRRFYTKGIDEIFQTDLVFLDKNNKEYKPYKYLLLVIDTFSKFLWIEPLKTKSGIEVKNTFDIIFKKSKRIPNKIHSDLGLEFISKETQNLFKTLKIQWYATENQTKAMIVERVALTIQQKMYKYLSSKKRAEFYENKRSYHNKSIVDIIQDIVENYNNSYHSTIKMTPVEASSAARETEVYKNLYGKNNRLSKQQNYMRNEKPVFKIDDTVRITKYGTILDRGYQQNFLDEVYKIAEILDTQPITYKIKDEKNALVQGSFYKQELSKYNVKDEEVVYEYILDYDDEQQLAFMKWLGQPNTFNSWAILLRDEFEDAKERGLFRPELLRKAQRKQRKDKIIRTKRIATLGK